MKAVPLPRAALTMQASHPPRYPRGCFPTSLHLLDLSPYAAPPPPPFLPPSLPGSLSSWEAVQWTSQHPCSSPPSSWASAGLSRGAGGALPAPDGTGCWLQQVRGDELGTVLGSEGIADGYRRLSLIPP